MFFILLCLFTVSTFANECNFDRYNSNCDYVYTSFNTFNVNVDGKVDNVSAIMYKKDNPNNRVALEIDKSSLGNSNPTIPIENTVPLSEPGVYVLMIDIQDSFLNTYTQSHEFVFDNTNPMPPKIPLRFDNNGNTFTITGNAFPNSQVIAQNFQGNQLGSVTVSNDGTFTMDLNLNSNSINPVRFYTKYNDDLKSAYVERVIFQKDLVKNPSSVISSLSIDSNLQSKNFGTWKEGNIYYTTKRDFYIEGSVSGSDLLGAPVYLNGIPVLSVGSGKFGGFVLLNEGENNLEVKAGNKVSNIQVNYIDTSFKFESVDIDKRVMASSVNVAIEANSNFPFDVYLNGDFVNSYTVNNNGAVSFQISGLKPGKNHISFSGFDNQNINEIVYYDNESPHLEVISPESISKSDEFVFIAKDDTGINWDTLDISIDNFAYSENQLFINGDYYILNISNMSYGTHAYTITVYDNLGKSATQSGQIIKDKTITTLDLFDIEGDGYRVGNRLYVKKGVNEILIEPSKYISFESILIDGVDQTNYHINSNGNVVLNGNFINSNGTIRFEFINYDRENVVQTLNYITDDEKPEVILDFISKPYSYGDELILISGEIIDSNFDWTRLNFNGENNFNRFGDYFEAYVLPTETNGNLQVSGYDYSGNSFKESVSGGLLYLDDTDGSLNILPINQSVINGDIVNARNEIKNYVSSYDGFDMNGVYVKKDSFSLPTSQREGLRSLNLNGVEASGNTLRSIEKFSTDSTPPQIYFEEGSDSSTVNVIISGTLSEVSEVKIDGNNKVLSSDCGSYTRIDKEDLCFKTPKGDGFEVYAKDGSGNEYTRVFNSDFDDLSSLDVEDKVYFNGNDVKVLEPNYFVQGQVVSASPIKDVNLDGADCYFDDYNFICYVNLYSGLNELEVSVKTIEMVDIKSTINVTLLESDIFININDVFGDNVFKISGEYYILDSGVGLEGDVTKASVVSLFLDGREELMGEKEGVFTIDISEEVGERISQKEEDEFQVWLEAEDDDGKKGISEKITLIYNRILNTLVEVIVE